MPQTPTVVPLGDVKSHLQISGTDKDAELLPMVAAAENAIAARVGPLQLTEFTDVVVVARGDVIALRHTPAVELLDISRGETPLNLPGVTTGADGVLQSAVLPAGTYSIRYTAGRSQLPNDLRLAVLELVRHFWAASQRGSTRRPGSTPDTVMSGYLMPNAVVALLAPHEITAFA